MDDKDIIIAELQTQIAALTSTIGELQEVIRELRSQLNQNSHNSSQPPSSDGFKKFGSGKSRKSSGKKVGGQQGHKGAHMEIPHEPDEVKQHLPEKCQSCPHLAECLASGKVFRCGEKRYEVNAVIRTTVTEHQSMKARRCPCGEQGLVGRFPENLKAYVQYGDSITVLAGLLNTYGAVSVERTHVLLSSLLDVRLSTGTIADMVSRCALSVGETMKTIRNTLINCGVVNFDETGADVNGKLLWVHNASTPELTWQTVSEKRGQTGMEECGVLPEFTGIGVHDCWGPYWKYDRVTHAVCSAHLLRELTGAEEYSPTHKWATQFKELLLSMKNVKEKAIGQGKQQVSRYYWRKFDREYDQILALADEECPPPAEAPEKKRGRVKKGKERSLIERLRALKGSVCLFVKNFQVPFDNNQAERDIRNVKTKLKVSGCFRTKKGLQHYLDVMSFISTGRKHNVGAFDALTAALSGNANILLS